MASIFVEIKPDNPNGNPEELADLLDAELVSLGAIGILDLQLEKRVLFNNPLLLFTLSAEDPGPLEFRAAYFSEDQGTTTDLDTQYNDFFAADTSRRAFYVFDVSSELRRSTNRDAIIVVYSESAASNFGTNTERVVVVEATENIPSNATGAASIVSSGGLQDSITIRNRSQSAWASGDRGYAAISNTDASMWDGYQICCNV
jgi:hypothetical protein